MKLFNALHLGPLVVDCSISKITDGSNIVIAPKFNFQTTGEDITGYSWTVGSLSSNYKESDIEDSFSTKTVLTPLDEELLFVKISNISEGEVCFIQINLTITTALGSYSTSSTQTIYKGTPRTVPFSVLYVRNGRLISTRMYDSAIQNRILNANKNIGLFSDDDAINKEDAMLSIDDYLGNLDKRKPEESSIPMSFMTNASQVEPNPDRPGSWEAGDPKSTSSLKAEDTLMHAKERILVLTVGKPPGYSSVMPALKNPSYSPVPIKTPGRSTHLVETGFGVGNPNQTQPVAMVAIPYPCGPGSGPTCSSSCSTSIETRTVSRANDVCSGENDQATETETQDIDTTTETCG